jgi:rod shape-determining protein MreC
MIAAGSQHGVERGQGVLSAHGVVGRVSAVAPTVSRVLLLSDPSSGVAAVLASNRAQGIIVGRGEQPTELRYLPPDTEVARGAIVVTSGFDTVFPNGLPIGTVVDVRSRIGALFYEVSVKPGIDERVLEEVFILTERSDELFSASVGNPQRTSATKPHETLQIEQEGAP